MSNSRKFASHWHGPTSLIFGFFVRGVLFTLYHAHQVTTSQAVLAEHVENVEQAGSVKDGAAAALAHSPKVQVGALLTG